MTYTECFCGSGLERRAVHDARNIFVAYVCDQCEAERLGGYRQDIFDDPNYPADEPIEDHDVEWEV